VKQLEQERVIRIVVVSYVCNNNAVRNKNNYMNTLGHTYTHAQMKQLERERIIRTVATAISLIML
jgi:hypothetical protein